MGQRAIKGVLARNDWSFYEYSTAWAFTLSAWYSGGYCTLLINNGTQQGNMDVFRAELNAQGLIQYYWFACPVPTPYPTNMGAPVVVAPCETNQPQPLGYIGAWNNPWFTVQNIIKVRLDANQSDVMELSSGPFVTLAPNWCLGVVQFGVPATQGVAVGVSFWYQVLLDNVSQVR
jgi:hypothetical protein